MEKIVLKAKRRIFYKDANSYRAHNKSYIILKLNEDRYVIMIKRVLSQDESIQITDEVIAEHSKNDFRQYYRRCGITIVFTKIYISEEGLMFLLALLRDMVINLKIYEKYETI